MDELIFVDKVRRIIKMRHDDVVAAMVSGGVDNMEKYQNIGMLFKKNTIKNLKNLKNK